MHLQCLDMDRAAAGGGGGGRGRRCGLLLKGLLGVGGQVTSPRCILSHGSKLVVPHVCDERGDTWAVSIGLLIVTPPPNDTHSTTTKTSDLVVSEWSVSGQLCRGSVVAGRPG